MGSKGRGSDDSKTDGGGTDSGRGGGTPSKPTRVEKKGDKGSGDSGR